MDALYLPIPVHFTSISNISVIVLAERHGFELTVYARMNFVTQFSTQKRAAKMFRLCGRNLIPIRVKSISGEFLKFLRFN